MKPRLKDLTGMRFGRLLVSYEDEPRKTTKYIKKVWVCRCDCGNQASVLQDCLIGGKTRSCGCLKKEKAGRSSSKKICKHGYPRIKGNSKDCDCPIRIRQKKSANLKCNYGIDVDLFDAIVRRQYERCLGCQKSFILNQNGIYSDAFLDHDHQTGQIRGVLCFNCNTALGNLKEKPESLRRLMAYLTLDRKKPLIYLIGRLKSNKVVELANFLRDSGYDVFEDWHYCGPDADDYWQKNEKLRGRDYFKALHGRAAQNIFLFDRAYLDLADAAVLMSPAGKSAFLELGYVRGNNKPAFILLPKRTMKRFEVMTKFASGVFETKEEILNALNSELKTTLTTIESVISAQKIPF